MKNLIKEQYEDLVYLVDEALSSIQNPYTDFIPLVTVKSVGKYLEEIREILCKED